MDTAPAPLLPWDMHPALTAGRLALCARLLVRGRSDAVSRAEPRMGDDAWSVGCRAYSFSRHQLRRAAESGRHPWLRIADDTQHFVFLIDGVPVRFYRGSPDDPGGRTLANHEIEARQMGLLPARTGDAEGLLFRLAVETGGEGEVKRVVFLALRGEDAECFWPVPLDIAAEALRLPPRRGARAEGQMSLPIEA